MADEKIEETLKGKYPAKSHTHRVIEYLSSKSTSKATDKGTDEKANDNGDSSIIYLESAKTQMNEDNDQEAPFRQRRYFYYLTGCELPDCYLIYDVKKGQSMLFIPPVVDDDVVWSGLPLMEEEALKLYDVDQVLTSDKLPSVISSLSSTTNTIYAISSQVSSHIDLSTFSQQNTTLLKEAIEECRVTKDEYEVALTRKANQVSELAHVAVLKAVKSAKNERELQALFLQQCIANGCRHQAYSSIVATGTDAATLHYVHNDKDITSRQLNLLLDAGGEYNCYASDITRTFPINGTFTRGSANIYSIVLKMQKESIAMLKAGVLWDDVHASAHKTAIRGLLDLGILKGDAQEIFDAGTSVAFFPHGLGHYLGMDTHDTGGHPNYADKDPMFKYLRVRGKLPAGSIITVEPGIYFCKFIIDPYLENPEQSKYINKNVLDGYWEVGGVRIEDNVLITEDGYTNLTTVPKEIDELEKIIRG